MTILGNRLAQVMYFRHGLFNTARSSQTAFLFRKTALPTYLTPECRHASSTSFYDALGVTPRATQTQIKAAYYEMSKQFHPDMNDSPDAKKKFPIIAEAYEVLGNVKSRRLYDRGMITPSGRGRAAARPDTTDLRDDIIKNRGSFGRRSNEPHTGQTDIYNFDEYYRKHYGANIGQKAQARQARQDHVDQMFHEQSMSGSYFFVITIIIITLVYLKEEHILDDHWEKYRTVRDNDKK